MRSKNTAPSPQQSRQKFLTPVTRTTLTAGICRKMVGHLIRGDWAVGDQLPPERELCLQLGVGRASLREALKALEIMGMIETRLGEGTFVCHRSEFLSRPLLWAITGSDLSEAKELVEARELMEVELAGLAATRATSDDLKEIRNHLESMQVNSHNMGRFHDEDMAFHLAISTASHNRILANALRLMRNLMQQWIAKVLEREHTAAEALDQHKAIYVAIAQKTPEAARAEMKQHLELMGRYLLEVHFQAGETAVSVQKGTSASEE